LQHHAGSTSSNIDSNSSKEEATEELLAAVAQLPLLKGLSLYELPVSATAAEILAKSTAVHQLRSLTLAGCSLGTTAVNALVTCCTSLTCLELAVNDHVGDVVLQCVSQLLQQLRHLNLEHTAVTDGSVMQLSRLTSLRSIELGKHSAVSEAARMIGLRMPRWLVKTTCDDEVAAAAAASAELRARRNLEEQLFAMAQQLQELNLPDDVFENSDDDGWILSDDEDEDEDDQEEEQGAGL
jgi:hypothetical protein